MAFKGYEQVQAEIDERGYGHADMEKIRRKICYEREQWKRKFDDYLEAMLREVGVPTEAECLKLVSTAQRLADLRKEALESRFDDDLEEE